MLAMFWISPGFGSIISDLKSLADFVGSILIDMIVASKRKDEFLRGKEHD
jgi:hypothetical protein